MRTYYKITVDGCAESETGEILARCEAASARQARRMMGVNEGNRHLVEVVPASKLWGGMYDPNFLRRRGD